MATVIDSLIVKLGLDTKDFQKGSKDADASFKKTKQGAKQAGKEIEQGGKQGAEFFNQLRKSAVQFFSVLTVGRGIADFTRNIITTGAQLDRMATRVGESASSLSRWQGAVRQSGGSAEGFLATVQGISNQFTLLKETGDAPIRLLLTQLGVSAADASGKAKPILQLIRDIGDALEDKKWANGDKFNKLAAAGFDEGTINLLMKGRQEREKLLASQKEYTDADARAAREAQEKWEKVKLNIERTTQALVIKLLPALEQIAKSMSDFAEVTVPILANVLDSFNAINAATDGWLLALGVALVSLKGIASLLGAGGVVAGMGVVGTALAGAAGVGGYLAGSALYKKTLEGNAGGDAVGRTVAKVMAMLGSKDAQESLDIESRVSKGALSPTTKAPAAPVSYDMANQLAAAEKANGLPAGLLSSIMKQETGNRKDFQDDPAKYHYEKDANGKRKSSAFGLFGILDSTAKDPGYGVDPLKDKSVAEQIRFAAQYSAARIKAAGGDVAKGMAGYGEGAGYASQVMGRLPGDVMSGVTAAGAGRGGQQSSSVSIGEVKVYTQATDANGIARDLGAALVRQADTGMR